MLSEQHSKSIRKQRGKNSPRLAKEKKAKPTVQPATKNVPYKFPFKFEVPAELLKQNKRYLLALQRTIQFNGPDVELAVRALFKLASNATLLCAMAASNPRTSEFAQKAARRMELIAVLKGNPRRLPSFSGALSRLKTFNTYHPRGPHKKASGEQRTNLDSERATAEWLNGIIETFWRGVVSRSLCIPPIPDEVRVRLLAPETRLNGREWAKALLDNLPKDSSGRSVEIYGFARGFFERRASTRKRPDADVVAVGFIKFSGERFNPLLKQEAEQAESAYQILTRERDQTNIQSR
jgi:hypothetical protein